MKYLINPWLQACVAFLLCSTVLGAGPTLDITYCSSENNGDDYTTDIWMSNGECHDHCIGSYVFAIIQGSKCYCSNYAPSNQVNTASCNQKCPGYPDDLCGNEGEGLYAYYNIGGTPSGSSGGSTTAPSSITSSPTQDPTQVYTSVISVTGRVSTIVVTPTAKPDSALGQGEATGGGKGGLGGGAVAGIVLGVALGLGAIIALAVWFCLRRRHQRNLDAMSEGGSYNSPSNASKTGNNGVPSRQTGGLGFFDNPKSAGTGNSNQDRASTHLTVDQRLNPWAIYSNEDSRQSNVSLQDNQDYSRQLRVANPDP